MQIGIKEEVEKQKVKEFIHEFKPDIELEEALDPQTYTSSYILKDSIMTGVIYRDIHL